ncbi:MAG: hypothetical protein J0H75_07980, partial [Rhizobiales bacterium]|nr:hypothetical protein [Hyphomicrobiales bacterium]
MLSFDLMHDVVDFDSAIATARRRSGPADPGLDVCPGSAASGQCQRDEIGIREIVLQVEPEYLTKIIRFGQIDRDGLIESSGTPHRRINHIRM